MSDIAIRVENLSKRYRIGMKEETHDTFAGALTSFVRSPLKNLKSLRRLSHFEENGHDSEDIIWALKDVSFEVERGEVLGIIGRNGAGKSTLLKILSKITYPTTGRVELNGRVASLLEVGTGFHPELTGRENIYLNGTILGMTKKEIDSKFDEIVDFSGVEKFIDTPAKRYSSGMRVRLAFSVAAHLEPEILLVDEVLAVGDAEFQKKCLGKMGEVASEGRTVLFVSHNMDAILNLCPFSCVIDKGRIVYQGKSEEALKYYLGTFSKKNARLDAHVVYEENRKDNQFSYIKRIEILTPSFKPKGMIYTWDDLRFRIHYNSNIHYNRGQFVLDIFDFKQQRLLVFDSGSRYPIKKGLNYVDCYVPRFSLAAGDYYLGAGLAVSKTEWLWRYTNLALIKIQGRDVFELGRPPISTRMIFVADHEWQQI